MMIELTQQTGMPPRSFVYERRSSTLTNPIPALTSNYELLRWVVPNDRNHFLLYGLGTDQHLNSDYKWVVDGVELPINGSARVGTPEEPYIFPEPIYVSGTVVLYITNDNTVDYPNSTIPAPPLLRTPYDEYPYECMIYGRCE